ncbi:MAG: TRAP transporter small permease [Pseudomonadota bacterium]
MVTAVSTALERLAQAANAVGTLVVLALVCVVNFDVVARGAFNAPFLGAVEVVQFSMVLIVFLQLPDVVRTGRLTRSDGFLVVMGNRYPAVADALQRLVCAISAIMMSLICIAIWPEFLEMWETQDFFGVPGVFTAPWWPIKLVITLSAGLCAALFILKVLWPGGRPSGAGYSGPYFGSGAKPGEGSDP